MDNGIEVEIILPNAHLILTKITPPNPDELPFFVASFMPPTVCLNLELIFGTNYLRLEFSFGVLLQVGEMGKAFAKIEMKGLFFSNLQGIMILQILGMLGLCLLGATRGIIRVWLRSDWITVMEPEDHGAICLDTKYTFSKHKP